MPYFMIRVSYCTIRKPRLLIMLLRQKSEVKTRRNRWDRIIATFACID